jgi:outer membrane lipoprotein LolB
MLRPPGIDDEAEQDAREALLAVQREWSFIGRVAVSQNGDGGSARIEWRQNGDDFDIRLSAPVTRQSWRLRKQEGRVLLEGLEGGVREGTDPEILLAEASQWRIPVTAMTAWVRGMRAAGPSELSFSSEGLPATIQQQGWLVEYRRWNTALPPRPLKIFARQGNASVRLAIETWDSP